MGQSVSVNWIHSRVDAWNTFSPVVCIPEATVALCGLEYFEEVFWFWRAKARTDPENRSPMPAFDSPVSFLHFGTFMFPGQFTGASLCVPM